MKQFVERHRNILDFTVSSLLRRKAKNLALVTVYAFVVFLVASVVFLVSAIRREAAQVLANAPEMVVQRLVAGRHDYIPLDYAESLREIKGVQSVKGRLWGYYFDPTTSANYTLMVSDSEEVPSGSIVVGRGVARGLLVKESGAIPFKTYDGSYVFLKIKGILDSELEIVSSDLILVSQEDFKRIFRTLDGTATDLVLKVRNPRELTTVATKITQIFPDTRPVLRDEILRTYDAVFDWRGGLCIVVLSGAILGFIILVWDKATGLSAEEKREIGILKGIGWETSDILLTKFWEGGVISLSSFFLGVITAYAHVFMSGFVLFEPAIKGWSVLYPRFALTPTLGFYQVSTLFFLTVVPYTLTTIIPSWRAATIDPDMVMRS
ncbi:MAG: ABC transporter permease [Syntrophobacteraceae bacterium]